jgi:hypothetical protein
LVFDVDGSDIEQRKKGLGVQYYADGWHEDDNGELFCPQCSGADDDRDEAYERAAARARNNDFADTGGKDWT